MHDVIIVTLMKLGVWGECQPSGLQVAVHFRTAKQPGRDATLRSASLVFSTPPSHALCLPFAYTLVVHQADTDHTALAMQVPQLASKVAA